MISPVVASQTPIRPIKFGFCTKLKEVALVVSQSAIRIIFISAAYFAAAAAIPATLHFFALPTIALSAALLSGFFFQAPLKRELPVYPPMPPLLRSFDPSTSLPLIHIGERIPLPDEIHAHVTSDAPRGMKYTSNNCWTIASVHFLESEPGLGVWLRNLLPLNMDMAAFENFLASYKTPSQVVNDFKGFAGTRNSNPPSSVVEMFKAFLNCRQNEVASNSAYKKISDIFNSLSVLREPFRKFFEDYDASIQSNRAVTQADTEVLRKALSSLGFASISHQEDPAESLGKLLDLLPDDQKIKMELAIHYKTDGLPKISGHPDSVIRTEEPLTIIPLAFKEKDVGEVTLQALFNSYCDNSDAEGTSLLGVDGKRHNYPKKVESSSIVEAPSALRFQIRRIQNVVSNAWYHRLFPWFKKESILIKKSNPVTIPPEFEISLPSGQKKKYHLSSFVKHVGTSPHSGHYTAGRIVNGQKYYMDNDRVSQLTEKEWAKNASDAVLVTYLPT